MKNKEQKLINASNVLKSEFVGLDDIIDQIINSVRPWYLLNNLITRPVIINLWGLTGVGKTHLVHRLAELIDKSNEVLDLDMATFSDWNVEYRISKAIKSADDNSKILVMDEFQLGRTIDDQGNEKSDITGGRLLWQLLDTGKFQIDWESRNLSHKIENLKYAILGDSEMKIANNQVDRDMLYKHDIPGSKISRSAANLPMSKLVDSNMSYVFTKTDIMELFELLPDGHKWPSVNEFACDVNHWDTFQFKDFLCSTEFKFGSASELDLSKSIIFVIGNLDEAYTMHDEFNPDMDADSFHELSKRININHIKDALKSRFRSEQIARLGNTHIIYPAFSSQNYKDIISLLIKSDVDNISRELGIDIVVDDSMHELIYSEGVYPTQGVRPVQSSVYNLFKCNLIKSLSEVLMKDYKKVEVQVYESRNKIGTSYYNEDDKLVYHREYSYEPKLSNLRSPKMDDQQAVVAVHESGHALVSTILQGVLPDQIVSVSSGISTDGFVSKVTADRKVITKLDVVLNAAISLAGLIAERIVFGTDFQSRGSSSDLRTASVDVGTAVTKDGLFTYISRLPYGILTENRKKIENEEVVVNYNSEHKHNGVIVSIMCLASELAEDILSRNKKLLLLMADYLSDNASMSKEKFKEIFKSNYEFINSYEIDNSLFSDNIIISLNESDLDKPNNYKFRNKLKSEVEKLKDETELDC